MDQANSGEGAPWTVGVVASSTPSQPAGPTQLSPGELQGETGGNWSLQPHLDLHPYFLRDH